MNELAKRIEKVTGLRMVQTALNALTTEDNDWYLVVGETQGDCIPVSKEIARIFSEEVKKTHGVNDVGYGRLPHPSDNMVDEDAQKLSIKRQPYVYGVRFPIHPLDEATVEKLEKNWNDPMPKRPTRPDGSGTRRSR